MLNWLPAANDIMPFETQKLSNDCNSRRLSKIHVRIQQSPGERIAFPPSTFPISFAIFLFSVAIALNWQ